MMDDRLSPRAPAICVFCGARPGNDPAFTALARAMGQGLAQRGWTLVFGGGHVGMMGEVADGVLDAGGRAIGVIPQRLMEREVAHKRLDRLEVVEDMPVRKTRLIELADAFIALPGGFGTLDELFEVMTLGQLHYIAKPMALTGVQGFWSGLDTFSRTLLGHGYIGAEDWSRVGQFDGEHAVGQTLDWLAQRLGRSNGMSSDQPS
jgi:uncharacterized protein (TIGR00730 family)